MSDRKPLRTTFPTIDNEVNRIASQQDADSARITALTTQLEQLNNAVRKLEARKKPGPKPGAGLKRAMPPN